MTNPKKGVGVKISGKNSEKVIKIIKKTHRTFATEVNIAVEEYDPKVIRYVDNGR
jgi:hypothetical protein